MVSYLIFTLVSKSIHPNSLVLSSQNAKCFNTPTSLFDKLRNTKVNNKTEKQFQMRLHAFH